MDKVKWLVFGYNLPAEPTRARVSIWRRLKKLGAVNVKQSIWFMPYSVENCEHLRAASAYIEENGGTSLLLESTVVDEKGQDAIIAVFNETRKAEYAELTAECAKFLQEIEDDVAKGEFIFAELEEEEAELEKLKRWYNTDSIEGHLLMPCEARSRRDDSQGDPSVRALRRARVHARESRSE